MKQGKYLIACLSLLIILMLSLFKAADTAEHRQERYRPQQFERDERAEWQKVSEVIDAMGLKEGMSIADIGGGSGYFSRPFAKKVGPKGVVYCCELATNLLEYLQVTAWEQNLHNIVTVYAAPDRPMLPPESLDILFFCNTNHHLEDRVNYYKKLIPILKPGGKIVVVDWKKERLRVGPPPGHCVDKSIVIREMKEAGWKLTEENTEVLEYQYFLFFEPES